MVKKGLTLIEVVVAIFLLAVVVATGLLLLSGNLNVLKKANELTIANALMQYSIEEVKNIDFPPVYYDRLKNQTTYGKIADEITEDSLLYIDSNPPVYTDFTPEQYKTDYRIIRFVRGYDGSGQILPLSTTNYYDNAMALEFIVYVLRKRGNKILLKQTIYRSRDGLY
jgi:prepilin-type N-terminal cleavage/methylation domain-containing protein